MSQESTSPAPQAKSYKQTLNLPKTSFPMRANLVQNEPASLKRWAKMSLYDKTRQVRSDESLSENKGRWSFHDGPPYTSGSIHVGHLLNKVLKDLVVRTRTMMGFDVPYVPGWDCHGLPIEHKVMTELVESGKAAKLETLTTDQRRMAIRRECQKYAAKYHKIHTPQMERLLTLADYAHPYLTMQPEVEAGTLEVFADLVEQGLVYRALKPVHWSIENQTALAEAELEYYDREDVSVYVRFDVEDVRGLLDAFGLTSKDAQEFADLRPNFMIWTTTPWTLPANMAVAVHPRFEYALAMVGGKPTVIAQGLLDKVRELSGEGSSTHGSSVLATCKGEALVGLTYRHPFCDRVSPVVTAEYVTLEDGTGIVHTAPGHGTEDYQTGKAHDLAIYCPVRFDGTFDDTVPDWLRGHLIWKANPKIVETLRESGHLYFDHKFTHSYPHDWRGKSPVIFRATEQWFAGVDRETKRDGKSLRAMALNAADEKVTFFPEWGRNRMRGMLEGRPDWCLSRQRAWGLSIPAFFNEDGTEILLTKQSVLCVADKVRKGGSDVLFTMSAAELLDGYDPANDPDAPEWLLNTLKSQGLPSLGFEKSMHLQKSNDIFDVWFESGSTWHAVMEQRGQADLAQQDIPELYLEGSDQHRGWFQASLLTALGARGQAPYKALLTHGFIVDKDGRKMSKSIGNTLEVEDLMRDYGSDVCRWWVASTNFEGDIKMDKSLFDVAGESYRKIRNTLRFLLSNLDDFTATTEASPDGHCVDTRSFAPTSIDAWVLGEYNKLAAKVIKAYERFDFKSAHHALYDFCNDTLSAVYLTAVKDRMYCDKPDSVRRRRSQSTMWELCDGLSRLLAPILPHTADEAYRALWKVDPKDAEFTVHLKTFIPKFEANVDEQWPAVMKLRDAAMLVLEKSRAADVVENPLDAELHVADPEGVLAGFAQRAGGTGVDRFVVDFADLLGVSRVQFVAQASEAKVVSLMDQPRCERSWKRDETVRERSDGSVLSERDAVAVGVK